MKTQRLTRVRHPNHRGFALVVTLSLMILLTVIAVGLLTLSSVELRSSSKTEAMAIAKSNARMALMLAIGELQRQTGPDTRVTARADVLDDKNPPVLGAWKSWAGANHETSGSFAGRPISPGDYKTAKQDRFLAWLVSGENTGAIPSTGPAADKVSLVGVGSVGEGVDREKLQINLTPSEITAPGNLGSFAWWIGGENQKARIAKPYKPSQDTPTGWAKQMKGHSVTDPKPFRMESILTNPALADNVITRRQGDLIASPAPMNASKEFFHDFSANSSGLLTNTATGGWRKDLSLLTEKWADQPKYDLPFFRVSPDEDLLYTLPDKAGDYLAPRSMIYPWSLYRNIGFNIGAIFEVGAVSSWESLANFATTYKSMKNGGTALDLQYLYTERNNTYTYDYHHKPRILPVLARTQWVFSHWAADPPAGSPPGTLEARLLATPVFTLWNPYNVELTYTCNPASSQQTLTFWHRGTLPNAFRYTVGGKANQYYKSLLYSRNYRNPRSLMENFNDTRMGTHGGTGWRGTLVYSIRRSFTLKPGQTLLFSPVSTPRRPDTDLELQPGYRPNGGHYFTLENDSNIDIVEPSSSAIKVEAKFDSELNNGGGVGIYLEMLTKGGSGTNWQTRILAHRMNTPLSVASTVYPPISNLSSSTLAEAKSQPQPFLTTICGSRTGTNTHLASKGLVQTSPIGGYSEMAKTIGHPSGLKYPGADHPVNSLSDYSFKALATGDSFTPNSGPNDCGYIVTGFNAAEGLSRCILAEFPTRPLQSLAELTNWDIRYDNPAPPFSFNLIGNSDASPLFQSNTVWNTETTSVGQTNLQHDDSYCTNHLLFDDWIFSSLAPNAADLGAPGPQDTLKKAYTEFIKGITPLPNQAYKAITSDVSLDDNTIDAQFSKHVDQVDSWKSIASRFEVEGMFNVNSTSVEAWRALLGHARGQKIPYYNAAAAPTLSAPMDYAYSRFSIAGDLEASSPTAISGAFPGAAEFSGYRTLDDAFLDLMAKEIVNQVRQRGPFLSLAEFVNRQLSSNETLAVGGTIQVALDSVARSGGSSNIFAALQSPATQATANPVSVGQAGYKFPKAAEGYNAYGLPGWTRQADVLRPLAPILSARDDTFTIRAYGDARDSKGTIKVRATCEAVVRRTRDFVDPADNADITTLPTSPINQTFGRQYKIISFRWLNANEI